MIVEVLNGDFEFYKDEKPTGHFARGNVIKEYLDRNTLLVECFHNGLRYEVKKAEVKVLRNIGGYNVENIREKYNALVQAFKEEGLIPDIAIWLHDGRNEHINEAFALDIIKALTNDFDEPEVDRKMLADMKLNFVKGNMSDGQLCISFPILKD